MMILTTTRLVLRATTEADIPFLHERIFSDPEVVRYVFAGKPFTPEESREFIKSKFNFSGATTGLSTLEEKATGEVIGFSGLNPCCPLGQEDLELGFVLARSVWRKGYATEIGKAQVNLGFERLEKRRLLAMVDPNNAPSIRVLTKLGLRYQADVQVEGRGLRKVYGIEQSTLEIQR